MHTVTEDELLRADGGSMLPEIKKQVEAMGQQVGAQIENPDLGQQVAEDFSIALLLGTRIGLLNVIELLQAKQAEPIAFSLVEVIKTVNSISVKIAEYEQRRA